MNADMPVPERVLACMREWSEEHPETAENGLLNAFTATLDETQRILFERVVRAQEDLVREIGKRVYMTGFRDGVHMM